MISDTHADNPEEMFDEEDGEIQELAGDVLHVVREMLDKGTTDEDMIDRIFDMIDGQIKHY